MAGEDAWPGDISRRRLPLHRRARFSSQGFFPQRRFRIAGIRPSARCCANGDGILLNRKHGRESARPGNICAGDARRTAARASVRGFFPQRRFRIAGMRPSARCCANGDGILLNRKHGRENARPGDVLRRRRPPHRRACLHSRDSSRQRRFRVASKRFCRWDVSQAAAAFS